MAQRTGPGDGLSMHTDPQRPEALPGVARHIALPDAARHIALPDAARTAEVAIPLDASVKAWRPAR
jgi:hypothetical protein